MCPELRCRVSAELCITHMRIGSRVHGSSHVTVGSVSGTDSAQCLSPQVVAL